MRHAILVAVLVSFVVTFGLSPIVYAEEYAAGHVIESRQSFAENVIFGTKN